MLTGPITTVDYHTGGEPFRIVTGGVPGLEGRTVRERRRWATEHVDDVRRLLVNEPRGHADMYGCFVTPPDDDGEVDRSPCGSGTSARLAILHERGEIGVGETLRHRSIVDSVFDGRVVTAGPVVGGQPTVITEVEGAAFRTGEHTFSLDERDPLGRGFLLR